MESTAHSPGPFHPHVHISFLKRLFCSHCGQSLAGHRVSNVNNTTGACPQAACHAAHSCLLVKQVPIPSEAALAHRTTFSGFPGAGRLPPSAGSAYVKFNFFELYIQLEVGSPQKLQMFPPKDEKSLKLGPLCLFLSCDSSGFRVMARIMLPSYLIPERKKLEREHLALETSNTSKSS